ncbi:hypothetical protein TNCV_2973531 [Trichonephila clavipes]|nr:hypothetical protein TNCV_2973531 [Trichonephila clavipes]
MALEGSRPPPPCVRHWIQLYLSPRSKADFGTVEITKEHGGFGASELIRTRGGITESEPFLRILCIKLSSRAGVANLYDSTCHFF